MPGRLVDECLPQLRRLGVVAALQQHHTAAGAFFELVIGVELGARRFVERIEVAYVERRRALHTAHVDEVLDEHAERRAPVAEMVLAGHLVTDELEHPHQRVADDGGAQVADVHLLGHVGRRVIHHHPFDRCRAAHAEVIVARHTGHLPRDERRRERDVDEPRPGHLEVGHTRERVGCCRNHIDGHVARRPTEFLGQGEGTVGLCIGTVARAHHRVGSTARHLGEGGREQIGDDDERISHGVPIVPAHPHWVPIHSIRAIHSGRFRRSLHSGRFRRPLAFPLAVAILVASRPRSSGDRAMVSGTMCRRFESFRGRQPFVRVAPLAPTSR